MTDARKQSLYFPDDMLQEIQEAAQRQDRSLSWIVQRAWRIARARLSEQKLANRRPSMVTRNRSSSTCSTPTRRARTEK